MAINWSKYTYIQRQALTKLDKAADLENQHRREHIIALIEARATGVSWTDLAEIEGVPRETIISRYKAAVRRRTNEH